MAVLFILGYVDWGIHVGAFFFAVVLGALGASVSLMKRIMNKEPLFAGMRDDDRQLSTFIPILYGTLMAGIAYLLFMSGILSGDDGGGLFTTNLFPNFIPGENTEASLLEQFVETTPDGIPNAGKLLIWCFIAGYSERFVTGILHKLEATTPRSGDNAGA
jgi:hypothetical protein